MCGLSRPSPRMRAGRGRGRYQLHWRRVSAPARGAFKHFYPESFRSGATIDITKIDGSSPLPSLCRRRTHGGILKFLIEDLHAFIIKKEAWKREENTNLSLLSNYFCGSIMYAES